MIVSTPLGFDLGLGWVLAPPAGAEILSATDGWPVAVGPGKHWANQDGDDCDWLRVGSDVDFTTLQELPAGSLRGCRTIARPTRHTSG